MKIACGLLALVAVAGSAQAGVWVESPDAGLLPGGAQSCIGTGSLDAIQGSLTPDGASDVDMFRIRISNPAAFSATTNSLNTVLTDTTLYLFNLDGSGIVKNDDIDNSIFLSRIDGTLTSSLVPGDYLIAVSIFGTIPFTVVSPSALSESVFDATDFTGQTGPQNGTAPVVSWTRVTSFNEGGAYEILLTGAEFVPTPGASALAGLGLLAGLRRRR
jgi:uncharacterized protein (TIGR03382 family)